MTAKLYGMVSLIPGAILVPWALMHVTAGHILPIVWFSLAYLILAVQSAPLSGGIYLNMASPVGVAVFAVLTPAPAVLVPLLGVIVASRRLGRSWLDTASNLSTYATAYAAAAAFYGSFAEQGMGPLQSWQSLIALVGALAIDLLINVMIIAPRVALAGNLPIRPTVWNSMVYGGSWGHHSLKLMALFVIDGYSRGVSAALPVAVVLLTGVNGSIRFFLERDRLVRAAAYDALTGAYSRGEWHQACVSRATDPALVMLIDVDGLKRVNDTYGHLTGDQALKDLAESIIEAVGKRGRVFRYGGDEFIVWAVQTYKQVEYDVEAALHGFSLRWMEKGCSVSAGSAFVGVDAVTLVETLRVADEDMYAQRKLKRVQG